jgi:sec-independent protein translocase protein TatC
VVVVVLAITGLVSIEQLREWRGYVVVGIFVIAAIVTPPDVVSQLALAFPMWFLYEVGIIVAQVATRGRRSEAAAAEPSNE